MKISYIDWKINCRMERQGGIYEDITMQNK